jgi:hypothetical protein
LSAAGIPFVPVKKNPPVEDPGVFSAAVSGAATQPASEPGLRFRLVVTNESDAAVELDNPYESLNYEITDAEGWPIATAKPVRKVRVDGPPRGTGPLAAFLGLEAAEVAGESVAPDEAAAADTFTLEAGNSITLDLVVPEVLTAYQATTTASPAPGEYHVKVLLPLRWSAGGSTQSFMLRSASAMDITVTDG